VIAPLRRFEPAAAFTTNVDRKKMQQHGVNPAFGSRGGMNIVLEGDLFGTDSSDYVTKKLAMTAALFGGTDPNKYTNRSNGRLTVNLSGQSEDWYVDVVIMDFSAPVAAVYPALTSYLLTLFGWLPYFTGATTPTNRYYW
jgi:hypothetical protein